MIQLYEHQKRALEQTSDRNRCAYYLDMGLGKTFVGSEKMIRLGWDIRGKFRMAQTTGEVGPPWLIPGFGKNDTSGWGGTFKVMVEL